MHKTTLLALLMLWTRLFAISALDPNDPKWAWMDEQIEKEFAPFERGITTQMLNNVMNRRPGFTDNYMRFQIVEGKVIGDNGDHNPKGLLELIASLYPLPDMDVVIFTQDIIWHHWEMSGPVLGTCKTLDNRSMIFFPVQCWEMWIEQSKQIAGISPSSPWEEKKPLMFWRGTANGPDNLKGGLRQWRTFERGRVVSWSEGYPTEIDAAFTSAPYFLFASDNQMNEFLSHFPLKRATWEEYLGHKYLIDLDGYVASTPGTAWKQFSNCAVFKRDSRFKLWFSCLLEPWVHYIPLEDDLSDIFEKIDWARTHDLETKAIADQGHLLAADHLTIDQLLLYCYKVLVKHASLQH